MQIDPNRLPVNVKLPAAELPRGFRLGDQFAAKVEMVDGKPMLRLSASPLQLPLPAGTGLRPGQAVTVQVTQLQPSVVLKVLPQLAEAELADVLRTAAPADDAQPAASPARTAPAPLPDRQFQQTVESALRALLPQAGSRIPLAETLRTLLTVAPERLPPALRDALSALLTALPRADEAAEPTALRQAISRSGVFLESMLARTPAGEAPALPRDLKALLLRVLARAQAPEAAAGPKQAARALESALLEEMAAVEQASGKALQRLQLLQLQSVQSRDGLDLLLELPLRLGEQLDHLQLQVQEEAAEPDQPERPDPGLQVRLNFGFQDLGRISVSLRLAQDQVSVIWWSEQPEVAALVREHLGELRERLEALGLTVRELNTVAGKPAAAADVPVLMRRGLVDEKA